MPSAALDRLARSGDLKKEPPVAAKRRGEPLAVAGEPNIDLAYNAAHSISLAALRFRGYRSENRYLVFQTLPHTAGLRSEQWRVLDDAHRKRNAIEYRGLTDVDEQLVAAVIRVAAEVARRVRAR